MTTHNRKTRAIFRLSGILVAVLAFPLLATAVTNTVSGPVGFTRITMFSNTEALVSLPFHAFGEDINALFAHQLTGATNEESADVIRKWDVLQQAYTNAYKADFTGDSSRDGRWFSDFTSWTPSAMSFFPGEGFWIQNRQSTTQTVFLCGTVVLDNTSTVTFVYGFSLFGYPFSSTIGLNGTTLKNDGAYGASPVTNADNVSDLIGGDYRPYWLLDDTNSPNHGKWVDASTNLSDTVFSLGRGYWYRRIPSGSFDWIESRPYEDLFPGNDEPPRITALSFNASQDEATLSIAATGNQGEKLEVYYQDLTATGGFTSVNWSIAATHISTNGQQSISWTDSGSDSRGKINTVYARYYLVGRGDIDNDGDSVADARETFVYGTDPNDPNSRPRAEISGTISYPGAQAGSLKIVAVTSSNSWDATFSTVISGPGAYTITNVPLFAEYWIKAFRDSDGDSSNDCGEARGAYVGNPFRLTSAATGIHITLADPDTDLDGMSDWMELRLGHDPLTSNDYSRLPFVELFETNTVTVGDLNGQNRWQAAQPNTVLVQTNIVYEGSQAIQLQAGTNTQAATWQDFTGASDNAIVWVDFNTRVVAASTPTGAVEGSAQLLFNNDGYLVVYDGTQPATQRWVTVTNFTPVAKGTWVRITMRMDYAARQWAVCLDGRKVADNLGFASPASELARFKVKAVNGFVDSIRVTTNILAGTSMDGDNLPDTWELEYFGNLNQTDAGDPDNDGLSNDEEYQYGTDPSTADMDNDGANDFTEIRWNRNPAIADTYASLPWTADFETLEGYTTGDLNNQQAWSVLNGTALVETSVVFTNAQAVSLSAGTHPVAAIGRITVPVATPVVWTDYYLKPAVGNQPTDLPARATAVYTVSSNGYWAVRSGTEWILATHKAAAPTGTWAHVTIKEDFSTRTWDFYVGRDAVLRNLRFADTNTSAYTCFAFFDTSPSTVYLDCIRVSAGMPGHVDADGDGLSNDQEAALGTDPLDPDTDHDGMSDNRELFWGFDPAVSNTFFRMDAGSGTNTWGTGFEPSEGYVTNALNGQNTWVASNNVRVVDNDRHAGVQSVLLPSRGSTNGPTENMAAAMGACGRDPVWICFYWKTPQGVAEHPELIGGAAVVGMSHNRLVAYDGVLHNWKISANEFAADSNGWFRLNIRLDYVEKKYLVCVNGLLALDEVNFNDPTVSGLSRLMVCGSPQAEAADTYVDDICVSSDEPAGTLDFDNDGLTNAEEYQHGTDTRKPDTDDDGLSDYDEIFTYHTDPTKADSDNDGMPDKWELDNSLNPTHGADASLDPDGDGLSNVQEYQYGTDLNKADTDDDGLSDYAEVITYHTNPNSADPDADGLPDKWEVEHGTSPFVADATADPDNDGLTNMEEYQAGTNPHDADTDDDGVNDGWEVYIHADPLVVDFSNVETPLNVITITPANTVGTLGTWATIGGTQIKAVSCRGYVEYDVPVTTASVYMVEISGTQRLANASSTEFRILGGMDGEYLGAWVLDTHKGGKVFYVTPWLTNGTHRLRLSWDNVYTNTSLGITDIKLKTYSGPDTNNNGRVDWIDHRLSAIDTLDSVPSSKVSPLCVEGTVQYLSKMSLTGVNAGLKHGAGPRWYANIPLSPTGAVYASFFFEDGARSIETGLVWEVTDIVDNDYVKIRAGDSLLLSVFPSNATEGTMSISVSGVTNFQATFGTPVAHEFSTGGVYSVIGTFQNSFTNVTKQMTVEAVSASFPTNPLAAWYGSSRTYVCPLIPYEGVIIEKDASATLSTDTIEGSSGTRCTLSLNDVEEAHYLVARVNDEQGAIVDSVKVDGLWVREGIAPPGLVYVTTLIDGSLVFELSVMTGHFTSSCEIRVTIFAGGAVLENGSSQMTIHSADFDALGGTKYRIIVPPGGKICHRVSVYQGADLVGMK